MTFLFPALRKKQQCAYALLLGASLIMSMSHAVDSRIDAEAKNSDSWLFGDSRVERIRAINVVGNKTVPTSAIKAKIPYRVGTVFKPLRSSELIRAVYEMGYFKPSIQVEVTAVGPQAPRR